VRSDSYGSKVSAKKKADFPQVEKVGEHMEECLNLIQGVPELVAWFGSWPGFHDAEIISLA
jgi:hypothetical protein